MKKFISAVILILTAIYCMAATKQSLTLHMESGAKIVYYLDTAPIISFKNQTMIVTVDDKATDIPMIDVRNWEIGMSEDTGTTPITLHDDICISIYGNAVSINNPQSEIITIYKLNGQEIGRSEQPDAYFNLPQGLYIAKIANNTYKIAIR